MLLNLSDSNVCFSYLLLDFIPNLSLNLIFFICFFFFKSPTLKASVKHQRKVNAISVHFVKQERPMPWSPTQPVVLPNPCDCFGDGLGVLRYIVSCSWAAAGCGGLGAAGLRRNGSPLILKGGFFRRHIFSLSFDTLLEFSEMLQRL